MIHRTVTPPFLHFSTIRPLSATQPSAPPHSPPSLSPYLSSAQAEREARMEGVEVSALKKACRPEAPWQGQENQSLVLPDDVAWAVERGGFLGEEFSVDDLLDFDGLEPDKELEEEEEDKGDAFEAVNHKNSTSTSTSSASSAVSFEDPPLSDINLPTHDAAEFEWMSSIIDDSLLEYPPAAGVPPPYRPATHSDPQPKTHLSPPGENLCIISTEALVPVKAKRSKRPRIAGSAWPTAGATALSDSSASSTTTTTTTTSSSSCSSSPSYSSYLVTNRVSFLFDANPPQPKKQNPKKRGRKPKSHHEQNNHHPPPHAAAAGIGGRHCTHCGAQKTPQWRTGPQGPKTLCNACGVRYKSGRLMPEYRPAASPTFVSHVHSNSHRKVLEMRRKKDEQFISAAAPPVSSF